MRRTGNKQMVTQEQAVQVLTVNPASRRIEAQMKDIGVIEVALENVPTFFRWPIEGEFWKVRHEANRWILVGPYEDTNTETKIETLEPGEGKISADRIKSQSGDVFINQGTSGDDMHLKSRTLRRSNLHDEFEWYFGGQEDLEWKTIANIDLLGMWRGGEFRVQIMDAQTNLGDASTGQTMEYRVSVWRKDATDSGSVSGPVADYVRLVKSSSQTYELQVRQISSFRHMWVKAQLMSSNNASVVALYPFITRLPSLTLYPAGLSNDEAESPDWIEWQAAPINGSSSGTIHMPELLHHDVATNLDVAGDLTISGSIIADGVFTIIQGIVNTNSTTPVAGSGFTLTNNAGAGDMTITFSTAFSGVPACTFTPVSTGGTTGLVVIRSQSASSVRIAGFVNSFGALVAGDSDVNFTAIGPR